MMSSGREKLRLRFEEEYARLNADQRAAVDQIEGPVMVIAGPGTGKTQILASRIGKILLDTDALPENILCLTYTDAGVVAMRKRLLQFIGPDAYKVNICTFHAFCNDVIQENSDYFKKTAMDPVSELETADLLKQLINGFPKGHPLKRYRADAYYESKNLQYLFSSMKREGWTVEFLESRIDAYLADLPNRAEYIYKRKTKDFKAGDLKVNELAAEKEKMEKLRAAVQAFPDFQRLMVDRGRYDYDDMINWVIQAFEADKVMLSRYQEQFLYILVDEFQDTSGSQNRIVELLIDYWERPNVFVVGDDDQSIFRFQGANVENMLHFGSRFSEDLFTRVLTKNYRSTQKILDLSGTLIERNTERLVKRLPELSKDLVAGNDRIAHLKQLPLIRAYASQWEEMIGIASQVADLVSQGIPPGRIAVIYSENKYGETLMEYLRQLQVPWYSKRSRNLFDIPLPRKLILTLRYLESELDTPFSGGEMLFELLHSHWFGIAPLEIAKLSIEAANKKVAFRQLLSEKASDPDKDLFTPALPPSLKAAAVLIESWISEVPNRTLQQLVECIIRTSGLLKTILQGPEPSSELQALDGFFSFVREESRRNPSMNLRQFVGLLDLMESEDLRLPLVQVSGNDKGVNLLTAHGAKGLEFEYVFLAGCNASFWEKKKGRQQGYVLPDTVFASAQNGDRTEEMRRLFYVAITRAEQHLQISYARFRTDGREMEPSAFVEEIRADGLALSEQVSIPPEVSIRFAYLSYGEIDPPTIGKMEESFIQAALDRFVMNVTALNHYLHCPLEFYFNNIVRIPSSKNESMEFGTAVHFALEKLFKKMEADPKKEFPKLEEFIADFEWHMHRHRESFTREAFDRRMEYGREILSRYYTDRIPFCNKVISVERTIQNVVVDDVPLKGKLDKLEFNGRSVNVVDYKTGNPENARKKMKNPEDDPPYGGDYWRQAVFYKLLVDHYQAKDWTVVSTEFDFVEPDTKKNLRQEKLVISDADTTVLREQIVTVWQKIKNRDFYTGCGKAECHWCRFVKTYALSVDAYSA